MNKYISNLRRAINGYADQMRDLDDLIVHNNKYYAPAVADEKNVQAREAVNGKYYDAINAITRFAEEATAAAMEWGRMKGTDINDADMKLLSHHFDLTISDIGDLIKKHKNNATMLRAIDVYYKERHATMANREEIVSEIAEIPAVPSVENKVAAINNFKNAAIDLLQHIRNGSYQVTVDHAGGFDMIVDNFGDPGISSKKDLYVLGD